jgi:hypothetical protein
MSERKAKDPRTLPKNVFICKAIKVPPGTKSTQKLPRGEEMFLEPSYLKWWILGGSALTLALAVGIVIGRFLLR